MRVLFYALLLSSLLSCQRQIIEKDIVVLAKTELLDPVASADVYLNNRKLGRTDNFGIFEKKKQRFTLNRDKLNVIRVVKTSPYHNFHDAVVHVLDMALEQERDKLVVKARLKMKSKAKASNKTARVLLDKSEQVGATRQTVKNVVQKKKKTDKAHAIYMKAKKSLESKQPERALWYLKKLTEPQKGQRNYGLGDLFGAHVNEALAYYYLGRRYTQQKKPKLAYKNYRRALKILNATLANINSAPNKLRKNISMEARFNRALAVQRLYKDLGMKNYKIKAYQAWRSIYNSLNLRSLKTSRQKQIKKYAISSMQKLEKQIL